MSKIEGEKRKRCYLKPWREIPEKYLKELQALTAENAGKREPRAAAAGAREALPWVTSLAAPSTFR